MKKHNFFKFFSVPILCAISCASFFSCSSNPPTTRYSIKNGSQSLNGELGVAGKDYKNWTLMYGYDVKSAKFKLQPLEGHSSFDESIIFIDDAGAVNWTDKAIETTYLFKVTCQVENNQTISSPIIQLQISDKKLFKLNGGSISLYGEETFSGGDNRSWYATFSGEIISDYQLSIVKDTEIPFDITITNNKIEWSQQCVKGTYKFHLQAVYVIDNLTYTTTSDFISLTIKSKRTPVIYGGSLRNRAEKGIAGKSKLPWSIHLEGSEEVFANWQIVPTDGKPLPQWIWIDADGYVNWNADVESYEFKIKASVIDNNKKYEATSDEIVQIVSGESRELIIDFNPYDEGIKPITQVAGRFSDPSSVAAILFNGHTIPFNDPALKITFIDYSTLLPITHFHFSPLSDQEYAYLGWTNELVPGITYKIGILAQYVEPSTGFTYYASLDRPINIYVYYNFETDGWETIIKAAEIKDLEQRRRILEDRYSFSRCIGLSKNIEIKSGAYSTVTHKARLIATGHDPQNFLDGKFIDYTAFTFEFQTVLCDSNLKANTYSICAEQNLREIHNTWHFTDGESVIVSDLYHELNGNTDKSIINTFPDDVKNSIKTVYKQCYLGQGFQPDNSSAADPNRCWIKEKLFLPSMEEVGMELNENDDKPQAIEGTIYEFYKLAKEKSTAEKSLLKTDVSGIASEYWLRTPYYIPVFDPYTIDPGNSAINQSLFYSQTEFKPFKLSKEKLPIAPCFCI